MAVHPAAVAVALVAAFLTGTAHAGPYTAPSRGPVIRHFEGSVPKARGNAIAWNVSHFSVGQSQGRPAVALHGNVSLFGNSLSKTELTSGGAPIVFLNDDGTTVNTIGGSKTADFIGLTVKNTATSSTNSIVKTTAYLEASGTWGGTGTTARALHLSAAGGVTNEALKVSAGIAQFDSGTSIAFWNGIANKILLAGTAFPNYSIGQGFGDVYLGGGSVKLNVDGANRVLVASANTTFVEEIIVSGTGESTIAGPWRLASIAFASLPASSNGAEVYCSDCTVNSAPCTGSSTGAVAKRVNGAWRCD